ncbi:AMP-binding protein [Sphingopyxis sp.]|uniref:AMP-dependent synthetase/ligase n=1 Tax=Sphingopyxis sp. TaxID=1908224 RepID=UPI0025EE228F|nr:AMP-binding protein [Sphingopyxis sp.]MBK6411591.1 AMP-binding protein [Sphingopyxis sp.]
MNDDHGATFHSERFSLRNSVCECFQANVAIQGEAPALVWRDDSNDVCISWTAYGEKVRRISTGLNRLGVSKGEVVGLMLTNRPEFFLADTAIQHLNAVAYSVYNTASISQISETLRRTEARVVITERAFVDRLSAAVDMAACKVEHIILVDGPVDGKFLTLDELAEMTSETFDFDATWRAVSPDDSAVLVFTSGTTGPPKAVDLTHANLLSQWEKLIQVWPIQPFGRIVSYLPSAHIADRTTGIYASNIMGFGIFCCPDVSQLYSVIQRARPTFFMAVPRIWEKLKTQIETKVAALDEARRNLFSDGIQAGIRIWRARAGGSDTNAADIERHRAAEEAVFRGLRDGMGFGDVMTLMVGAAPMPLDVHEFFAAIGMPLPELWGMTESSAIATWNPPEGIKFGTVGKPLPDVEITLASDNEILVRGSTIMRGYRDDPVQTAETIDGEGWLHTGDTGEWTMDGYLKLTGRKKELIINSAGKNMSPMNIEAELKGASSLIGQVCVVGDGRKYNVALIMLDRTAASSIAVELGSGLEEICPTSSKLKTSCQKSRGRLSGPTRTCRAQNR